MTPKTPFYDLHASKVQVGASGASGYPVTVTLKHMKELRETGDVSTIRAKYVVGCEGSRSVTRAAIGRELADAKPVHLGLIDYEKVFCPDPNGDDIRGK